MHAAVHRAVLLAHLVKSLEGLLIVGAWAVLQLKATSSPKAKHAHNCQAVGLSSVKLRSKIARASHHTSRILQQLQEGALCISALMFANQVWYMECPACQTLLHTSTMAPPSLHVSRMTNIFEHQTGHIC